MSSERSMNRDLAAFNRHQARLDALRPVGPTTRQTLDALAATILARVEHHTVTNVRRRPFDWSRDECNPHGIVRPNNG